MEGDAPFETSTAIKMTSDKPQTPTFDTPPRSKTPPTVAGRNSILGNVEGRAKVARAGSETLDADQLARRLKDHDSAARRGERTPGKSPSRKRQRIYGDRFIPNREGQDLQASYSLMHDDGSPTSPSRSKKASTAWRAALPANRRG